LRNHNGSWYKLFNTISNTQEYPLADLDSTEGIFKTFIEALKNQPIKHNKLSIDWIIETNEYTPLISSMQGGLEQSARQYQVEWKDRS
jgi:hypothetical protein